jgi:tape measure domain-containing protein
MVVRELVTLLGFRVNEAQLRQAEGRMKSSAMNLATIGRNMTMFVTLPIALAGKALIGAASHVQLLNISLSTMLNDAGKAQVFIKELFQFAKETPLFQIEEIGNQAKRLLAVGFAAKDVIPNLRMLGDIAAGVNVPLQRIVLNYSQVRAQGKLTGRELRDFAVAGVPLLDALSKATGKTTKEIFGMIRKSQIPFSMVEQAFKGMTTEGGLFNNLMERMADTTKGRFLKFLDNIFLLRVELGTKLLPIADKVIDFLSNLVDFIRQMDDDWKRFSLIISGVAAMAGPIILLIKLFKLLVGPLRVIALAIAAIGLIVDEFVVWQQGGDSFLQDFFGDYEKRVEQVKRKTKELQESTEGLWSSIGPGLKAAGNEVLGFLAWVNQTVFQFMKDLFSGAIKPFFGWVASGIGAIFDSVIKKVEEFIAMIKRLTSFEGIGDLTFTPRDIPTLVKHFLLNPELFDDKKAATDRVTAAGAAPGVGTVIAYNPTTNINVDRLNATTDDLVNVWESENEKQLRWMRNQNKEEEQ